MRLLLDAGNSRIKWRTDGEEGRTGTIGWDELPQALPILGEDADEVWCAMPVHAERRSRLTAQLEACGLRPREPDRGCLQALLRPAYVHPERMGVDRLLALRAAVAKWPGEALVVIDAGTALTLDALDRNGHHASGMILPGLGLMGRMLASRTGLPELSPEVWPALAGGVDTEGALAAGLAGLCGGGLARLIGELEADLQESRVPLVVTGGDARAVAGLLGRPARLCQNLVLDGLALESER